MLWSEQGLALTRWDHRGHASSSECATCSSARTTERTMSGRQRRSVWSEILKYTLYTQSQLLLNPTVCVLQWELSGCVLLQPLTHREGEPPPVCLCCPSSPFLWHQTLWPCGKHDGDGVFCWFLPAQLWSLFHCAFMCYSEGPIFWIIKMSFQLWCVHVIWGWNMEKNMTLWTKCCIYDFEALKQHYIFVIRKNKEKGI